MQVRYDLLVGILVVAVKSVKARIFIIESSQWHLWFSAIQNLVFCQIAYLLLVKM